MSFIEDNTIDNGQVQEDYIHPSMKDVESFIGPEGSFRTQVKGFRVRPGQIEMAKNWQQTLRNSELVVCEAGTGTGKTFAYLIPALLSGKTVVISTASKALQDQLVEKDLPAVFDLLKLTPSFMALKGFSNYLCLKKYHEECSKFLNKTALKFDESEIEKNTEVDEGMLDDNALSEEKLTENAISEEVLGKLELLIQSSNYQIEKDLPNIDFAEVNSKFPNAVTKRVTCAPEWCSKKRCPYADECFPYLAREKAIRTKVVVINHSLFFADLFIDDPFSALSPAILLPKYRSIIFDEAHELPAIGREHMSETIGSTDIDKLKEDLRYISRNQNITIKPFEERFLRLHKVYADVFSYLSTAEAGGSNKRNFLFYKYDDYDENNRDPFLVYEKVNRDFRVLMVNLYKELTEYKRFIQDNIDFDEEFFNKVLSFVKGKIETLISLMKLDDRDDPKNIYYGKYVGTVEVSRKTFKMSLTPLEISDFFGKYLDNCYSCNISVLMTSATLAVNHKFDKFLIDIGAPADTHTLEVKSAFDYKKQAAVYLDGDFPAHNDADRIEKIIEHLEPVINQTKGGIFFLTTSRDALSKAASSLRRKFSKKRKIFSQNEKLSNSDMLQKFKQDGHAILVGTSSFWAGVDVPGQALSLVIIDKLPFENVSDPIFKARCDFFDAKVQRKGASFVKISVPEAVIDLRQGVGRLIRHEKDVGGLIICDPRIVNKNYGSQFVKSLPDMAIYNNLEDFESFLNSLSESDKIQGQ